MRVLEVRHDPAGSLGVPSPVRMAMERTLQEAVLRAVRSARGRLAVVLHLSRLIPPAPRPHHRRIAQAVLQDTANRFDGQVFVLGCGDMVLLCRAALGGVARGSPGSASGGVSGWRSTVVEPQALPGIMDRLLRADRANAAELVSLWPIETQSDRLLDYVAACLAGQADQALAPAASDDDAAGQTEMMDAVAGLVGTAAISDMMQRQTAIELGFGAGGRGREPRPLFREVTFSISALEARIASTCHATADPFLFRHLAARMDRRMLDVLGREMGSGSPLDVAQHSLEEGDGRMRHGLALHLNLTLAGVLSAEFVHFARVCRDVAAELGVEISLLEAVADPVGFARARRMLAETGVRLVLDGVSHLALLMANPAALKPDLMKLDWSPRLAELGAGEAGVIAAAIARIDPARIVLHRAETEAAVRWGLSAGIRRFQGRHVDAMLGAARIMACTFAHRCTLRQCIERAGAAGNAGRAGCFDTALIDAGVPPLLDVALPIVPLGVTGAAPVEAVL